MQSSVDSVSFVHSYFNLRPEEIMERGFIKIRDKSGAWKWVNNGMREIHEPCLTFYRTWNKIFRLRVDYSIPKLLYGSNIGLPCSEEIQDSLVLISNNVKDRIGFIFDAFTADTCRIHYAFNQITDIHEVKRLIAHYANFEV